MNRVSTHCRELNEIIHKTEWLAHMCPTTIRWHSIYWLSDHSCFPPKVFPSSHIHPVLQFWTREGSSASSTPSPSRHQSLPYRCNHQAQFIILNPHMLILPLLRLLQSSFFFSFIGVELTYNAVLVSCIQQSESVIHIHVFILFQIFVPYRLLQNIIKYSSLCYTVGPFLVMYFIYSSVYALTPNS